ncbi:unnamed protein product [Diatraea saccharalis]|uniref:HAT C-terminal dimerisation domain-containing protein n=1 Tax=Diatraea saccharalis TaxID=40085 RepID=A0A9N9WEA4_9NEOP|nr:unnamed protein product [Diatraea saccharalis]
MIDTAQLCVFIRMAFPDTSSKEEFLTIIPLKETTRGSDIYDAFLSFAKNYELPLYKLVCITTDGAPSMTGKTNGFVALCRANEDLPSFFSFHCVIHQQVLCSKVLNMADVMSITMKIVNSIRARSLQRRLFKVQLEASESEHTDLLLHTDVRWLSRGKFLERFQELLPEIISFLDQRGDDTEILKSESWLCDLAFLTDVTGHLNSINLELQGKDKTIMDMISTINSFKSKLQLLINQLKKKDLKNFACLKAKTSAVINYNKYETELGNILSEFERRFSDLQKLTNVVTFMIYPFSCVDVEITASEISNTFDMDLSSLENEMIQIISDVHLKAKATDISFWSLLTQEKYPSLQQIAQQLTALFGSTYLCESAFSEMKIIKSKYRNRLTDEHLSSCLRLALTKYVPSYEKLAENTQCHASTSM